MKNGENSKVVSNDLKETVQILSSLEEKMRVLEQEGVAKPRWNVTFQVLSEEMDESIVFLEEGSLLMEKLDRIVMYPPEMFLHGWLVPKGIDAGVWCDCCMQNEFNEKEDIVESRDAMSYSAELLMRDLEKRGVVKRIWAVEYQFVVGNKKDAEKLLEEGERILLYFRDATALRSKAEFSGWILPDRLKADLETPWTEYSECPESANFLSWNTRNKRIRYGYRTLKKALENRGGPREKPDWVG